MKALLQLPGAAQMQMSKGIWLQRRARGGVGAPRTGGGRRRTSCQGLRLQTCCSPNSSGPKGSRLLQLQRASRARVPLTHATACWSGLGPPLCCSAALGGRGGEGALAPHRQSVFRFNPQTSPFYLLPSSHIRFRLGCFWLPAQVIGTFSLNL